jgi:hypothetical protein
MESVRLQFWEEGIGTLRSISDEGPYKILDFGKFKLRLDEIEIAALGDLLTEKLIGRRISIMRTDLPNKPMILREHN